MNDTTMTPAEETEVSLAVFEGIRAYSMDLTAPEAEHIREALPLRTLAPSEPSRAVQPPRVNGPNGWEAL